MARGHVRQGMPHLFAGLIASSLLVAVLFGAGMVAVHLEHATILSTAPELFSLKNQGLAFQRAAAYAPNVLPLYGSSELTALQVPERANVFFRNSPTGFQVSPVGAGGTPPLIVLQKVAALGSALRGKKLAISLSPNLTAHAAGRKAYEGNFSLMAASEIVFGTALDFELKRQIASRMLECPTTLEKSPLLEFALRRLASRRWLDRLIFCALWPIGKVQNAVLEMQDHFAAMNYIRHKIEPAPRRHLEGIDWSKLIAKVSALETTDEDKTRGSSNLDQQTTSGSRDVAFRTDMEADCYCARWKAFMHERFCSACRSMGSSTIRPAYHGGLAKAITGGFAHSHNDTILRWLNLRGTMKTRLFSTFTRVTSPRKAGSITTAPWMISFMGALPGVDRSDS
jgi:DltD protein